MAINKTDLWKKVAKLIIVRASGYQLDSLRQYPKWESTNKELKAYLEQGIGGVILHGGNAKEIQDRCNQLNTWSRNSLLLCADVEEGVGQLFKGFTRFAPPMTFGLIYKKDKHQAVVLAEEYGKLLGEQARNCGLNWVLAPVCDLNTNHKNPVINMRAWGEDPQVVAQLVCAFNKGLVSQGVLSCAKHFPGHGDTSVDSHLALPVLQHSVDYLEKKELIPFKALIAEGVNSVMTAHLLLEKIDPNYPATFSKEVLSNLLRRKIGFQGLIVTDALVMEAVSKKYSPGDAAVMAFQAGADLLMMPKEPLQAIDAIVGALLKGVIPVKRLEESLQRRSNELSKIDSKFSFKQSKSTNTSFDSNCCESANAINLNKKLIDISLRTNHMKLGNSVEDTINLIRVDSLIYNTCLDKSSPSLIIPSQYGFQNIIIHASGISPWTKNTTEPLNIDLFGKQKIMLQLFIRGNPFMGNSCFEEPWFSAVMQLQKAKILKALLIFGSPYLWDKIINKLDPSIPAIYSPAQIPLAQEKVLQLLFKSNQNSQEILNKHEMNFMN